MDEKPPFGDIAAKELKIGDIVEWSKWNKEIADWKAHYGVVIEIKNEIKGNRMVSVSIVTPLSGNYIEMELFTPSLKLISRADGGIEQ
jgi:hypothetical protein